LIRVTEGKTDINK